MERASFLARHRRLLAVGAASLLLHLAALEAVNGWLGDALRGTGGTQPMVLNARLQLFPAPPAPAAPVMPAAPRVDDTPAAPREAPPLAEASPAPPASTAAPDPASDPLTGPTPDPSADPTSDLLASPTPDPLAGSDSPVPPEEAPERMPKAYRVVPPPTTEIAYDMTITAPDGSPAGGGSASLSWHIEQGRYVLRLESRYGAGSARDHARLLGSDGGMDDMGIAPLSAEEQHDSGDALMTSFDRAEGSIRYTRSPRTDAIIGGAQDQLSMLVQLAGIGVARRMRVGEEIALQVSRAAGAGVLVFTVIGEETLNSQLGMLATWHLAQVARPGAARIELWLAPAYHWMPVQIRSTGRDGVAATQLASRIVQPPR